MRAILFLVLITLVITCCDTNTPPNMIFQAHTMTLIKPYDYGKDSWRHGESIYIWPDKVHFLVGETTIFGKWEKLYTGCWILRNDSITITVTQNEVRQSQPGYLELVYTGQLEKNNR